MLVTLDSGHYGKYNQSPIAKKLYESEFNWKMTNYMAQFFREYGVDVRLTRKSLDRDLDLFDRGFTAKGSDIFLSIHANACSDKNVDFPVVIRGFNESSTDKLAQQLATRIEEIMDTRQEGKTWVRKKTSMNEEYYGVLRGARKSGVKYRFIIEHSFYTNPKAAKFLLNDTNIKKMAKEEVDIIVKYFKVKKIDDTSLKDKTHYVKVIQNNLNIRDAADWKATPISVVNKGDIFTVKKIITPKNGDQKMYLLKSGLYITTNSNFVKDYYK